MKYLQFSLTRDAFLLLSVLLRVVTAVGESALMPAAYILASR